jgi:hypothetical protein
VGSDEAGVGTVLLILFRVAVVVYCSSLRGEKEQRWLAYLALSIPFSIGGMVAVPLARIDEYFFIFAVLLLPIRVAQSKDRVIHAYAVSVIALLYYALYLSHFGALLPYRGSLF